MCYRNGMADVFPKWVLALISTLSLGKKIGEKIPVFLAEIQKKIINVIRTQVFSIKFKI